MSILKICLFVPSSLLLPATFVLVVVVVDDAVVAFALAVVVFVIIPGPGTKKVENYIYAYSSPSDCPLLMPL